MKLPTKETENQLTRFLEEKGIQKERHQAFAIHLAEVKFEKMNFASAVKKIFGIENDF